MWTGPEWFLYFVLTRFTEGASEPVEAVARVRVDPVYAGRAVQAAVAHAVIHI